MLYLIIKWFYLKFCDKKLVEICEASARLCFKCQKPVAKWKIMTVMKFEFTCMRI